MTSLRALNRIEALTLFVGDLLVFYLSLWLTLVIRYAAVPSMEVWRTHAIPFSILFLVWVAVFFIAGLYEKHTTILKSRVPNIVLHAQIFNGVLAALFFFLVPYFGITPKTILFIYLLISFGLIVVWRQRIFSFLGGRRQELAMLVGSGDEMEALQREVNSNSRYGLYFELVLDVNEVDDIDFKSEITNEIYSMGITTVVVDTKNERVMPILPRLYNLIFSSVRFIDMHKVYEDIFDRVPLSLVQYSWFLENISATRKYTYELVKRAMDILIALPLFVLSFICYPFVALAIKLDDGGPVFIFQNRIGEDNRLIRIAKFRTMTRDTQNTDVLNDNGNHVTRVGAFLRKTRIDELPQLWNVLKGDLSLIGPRPELPALVEHYSKEIPYYNVRHLIKPGLSGWAQLYHDNHPHHGSDVLATKEKLSYDLYYIKNRALLLDIKTALKTIKRLLTRSGR